MECAHPPALHRPRQEGGDAVPHLARRPVGERHRQHLAGPGQAADEDVGEAADQHPGLAGAGAGEHQHRSLRGLDGGPRRAGSEALRARICLEKSSGR